MAKQSTIFQTPHGNFSIHECDGYKKVNAFFLHTREQGDMNRITYLNKKAKSTRSITREQAYFIPNGELTIEEKTNLERGARFFSLKDGFLWGAYSQLAKSGKIVKIPVF